MEGKDKPVMVASEVIAKAYYEGRANHDGWERISTQFPKGQRVLAKSWYFRGYHDYIKEMESVINNA